MSKRAAIWKKRVASWRASGKTAKAFSAGREWSAGTLLWWSSRLRHEMTAPVVRVAHLIRSSADRTRGGGTIVIEQLDTRVRAITFRLRLVPGDAPHLEIHDAHHDSLDSLETAADPLHARFLERLRATSKSAVDPRAGPRAPLRHLAPHTTFALREALRVRKADRLAALRALETSRFVTRTALGWMIAESP